MLPALVFAVQYAQSNDLIFSAAGALNLRQLAHFYIVRHHNNAQ
jgi:hypothetical protein